MRAGLVPATASVTVRAATVADAVAIADIYNHYVRDTVVTFEDEPVPAREMARRMERVTSAGLPWLVAERGGRLAGYAYAVPWKDPPFGADDKPEPVSSRGLPDAVGMGS